MTTLFQSVKITTFFGTLPLLDSGVHLHPFMRS